MTSHFLFEAEFCTPAAGWEKGQIENGVRDARPRIWHEVPSFTDVEALNAWLERRCVALWQSLRHPEHSTHSIRGVGRGAGASHEDAIAL